MKIRCDLNLNQGHRRLILAAQENETLETLALKLSGYLLFWDSQPQVGVSLKHPALADQEFKPDLVAFDDTGRVALWLDCGKVALHKLDKLTRRYPSAKLVVLKASEAEGVRLREEVGHKLDRHGLLQILAWRKSDFALWRAALREDTHVIGDVEGRSLNLVINETPISADLVAL